MRLLVETVNKYKAFVFTSVYVVTVQDITKHVCVWYAFLLGNQSIELNGYLTSRFYVFFFCFIVKLELISKHNQRRYASVAH